MEKKKNGKLGLWLGLGAGLAVLLAVGGLILLSYFGVNTFITKLIPALQYDEGEVITVPTCAEEGIILYKNQVGWTRTEKLSKRNHSLILVEGKEPTCLEGVHQHYLCTVCGLCFLDAEAKQSIEEKDTVLAANGKHELVKNTEQREATCFIKGSVESWVCNNCGEFFSDSEGTKQISQSEIETAVTTHSYVNGYCENCGGSEGLEYKGTQVIWMNDQSASRIVIPEGVTAIGDDAIWGCAATSIVLPQTLTRLGQNAICACSSLTSIELPESLTYIGMSAINSCSALTSIYIPKNVSQIGATPFYGCENLTQIQVDEENPVFNSRDNCNAIIETKTATLVAGCKNSKVPDGVKIIGKYAFEETLIQTLTLPESVEEIEEGAFSGCWDLISVTLPESLKTIGDYAFSYSSIQSIAMHDNVTSIGEDAFAQCEYLTTITMSTAVTEIGQRAFYHCTRLTSLIIPDGVISLKYGTFMGCYSMTSLSLPKSLTLIDDCTFAACFKLSDFVFRGTQAEWNAIEKLGDWAGYDYSGDARTLTPSFQP